MNHSSIKKIVIYFALTIFTGLTSGASAQPISGEQIREQFLKDWQRAKVYTLDYLNNMPADKYSFRPVDSIRSFAQQMLHLAFANVFLNMVATGKKIDWVPGQKLNWHDGEKNRLAQRQRLENSTTTARKRQRIPSCILCKVKATTLPFSIYRSLDPEQIW